MTSGPEQLTWCHPICQLPSQRILHGENLERKLCYKVRWLSLKDTMEKQKSVYNKKSLSGCIMGNVGFTVFDA